MSDKSTYSYYHEDKYAEWLENLPQSSSEVVNELLEAAYHGESPASLSIEDAEANRLKTEVKGLKAEMEAKESLIEEYETTQEERIDATPNYHDQIKALLETVIENDTRIWTDHKRIQELATQEHKKATEVIEDAKDIASSMEPTFYNTQFVTMKEARQMNKEPLEGEQ